jgi:hypothetical protein
VYLRNGDLMKNILRFIEISCILLFTLSNKKYNRSNDLKKLDLGSFLNDFYQNMDSTMTLELSIIPTFIVKNIFNTTILIRKYSSEALLADLECTKIILYFSIIYSSQVDLITNPHLRAETFDIFVYNAGAIQKAKLKIEVQDAE